MNEARRGRPWPSARRGRIRLYDSWWKCRVGSLPDEGVRMGVTQGTEAANLGRGPRPVSPRDEAGGTSRSLPSDPGGRGARDTGRSRWSRRSKQGINNQVNSSVENPSRSSCYERNVGWYTRCSFLCRNAAINAHATSHYIWIVGWLVCDERLADNDKLERSYNVNYRLSEEQYSRGYGRRNDRWCLNRCCRRDGSIEGSCAERMR